MSSKIIRALGIFKEKNGIEYILVANYVRTVKFCMIRWNKVQHVLCYKCYRRILVCIIRCNSEERATSYPVKIFEPCFAIPFLPLKPIYEWLNFMDEQQVTIVVYELLLLLLITNFFYLVAPKGAFCLVGVLFACFRGRSVILNHHLSFTVSVFRSDEGACCSPHRNRTTCCFAYPHCSQRNLFGGLFSPLFVATRPESNQAPSVPNYQYTISSVTYTL